MTNPLKSFFYIFRVNRDLPGLFLDVDSRNRQEWAASFRLVKIVKFTQNIGDSTDRIFCINHWKWWLENLEKTELPKHTFWGDQPTIIGISLGLRKAECLVVSGCILLSIRNQYIFMISPNTWRCPKMEALRNHPCHRIFHYKPSIFGYPHLWKPPYVDIFGVLKWTKLGFGPACSTA